MIALVAFTRRGAALGKTLADALGGQLYTSARLSSELGLPAVEDLTAWTGARFADAEAIVFLSATGIAVRAIAPHVRDKFTDPAVVSVDEAGRFAVPRGEIMAQGSTAGLYDGLTVRWPFLAGPDRRAKPAFYSKLMSAWGFTGYLCPLTGESTLNVDCPEVFLPVTIAHEYAHQRGVAAEQEANFVGIMAAVASGRPAYVYSGWLYGYLHLSNALYRADPAAAAACMAGLPAAARADFDLNNAYWASWEGPIREVGETVYDAFLHSYGQELGMQSYGACVDLLVEEFLPLA